jgi:hypothetical protein
MTVIGPQAPDDEDETTQREIGQSRQIQRLHHYSCMRRFGLARQHSDQRHIGAKLQRASAVGMAVASRVASDKTRYRKLEALFQTYAP